MTSLNPVNTEQWRTNYNVRCKSRLVEMHRRMKLKRSLFNELVTDRDMKILDVGCGSGYFLSSLASRGFRNLYGIEPDTTLVNKIPPGIAVEIKNSRVEDIAFEDCTFDVVVVQSVLHHLKGLDAYKISCGQIHRVLKPGGLIFISEPGVYWILRVTKIASKCLGTVSSVFRALSECLDEEAEEQEFFLENHRFIKSHMEIENGFKVIVDKYFLYSWLFTVQKPNR